MKYTQENLAQFADMDIDLYAIGNKIIDKLTDYNPEIFDGYKFVKVDNVTVNYNYVLIWYYDVNDELKSFNIPHDVWCNNNTDDIYKFIVEKYTKQVKISDDKNVESMTSIWDYINSLKMYSVTWRRAIDKAASYHKNGLNADNYIKEIKEYAEN